MTMPNPGGNGGAPYIAPPRTFGNYSGGAMPHLSPIAPGISGDEGAGGPAQHIADVREVETYHEPQKNPVMHAPGPGNFHAKGPGRGAGGSAGAGEAAGEGTAAAVGEEGAAALGAGEAVGGLEAAGLIGALL